jgi:hypothetical protein
MKVIRWAAVAVTALFALLNLGAAVDGEMDGWVRTVGAVLCLAGIVAIVGFVRNLDWGRAAVIAVGVLNVTGAVAALIADEPGGVIGLVVGTLGAALGFLAGQPERTRAVA